MTEARRTQTTGIVTALVLTLAGLTFCSFNALGWLDKMCFTGGCRLTRDLKPFGLSLWWYGAGCFAVISILTAFKRIRWAFLLSAVALALDVVFLAWLALAAPCFTCILGGIFFLIVFFALFRTAGPQTRWPKVLVVLWFFVLSPGLFMIFQETASPWPLKGPPDAPIQVFFAPTCPACTQTMQYFMPDIGKNVAVYPISRNKDDQRKIRIMVQALEKGATFKEAYF